MFKLIYERVYRKYFLIFREIGRISLGLASQNLKILLGIGIPIASRVLLNDLT